MSEIQSEEGKFVVGFTDKELFGFAAKQLGIPDDECWLYKVVHPELGGHVTVVMGKRDEKAGETSALILP